MPTFYVLGELESGAGAVIELFRGLSQHAEYGGRLERSQRRNLRSEESYKIFEYDRAVKPTLELVFQRIHHDDRDLVHQTIDRASEVLAKLDFEHRLSMPNASLPKQHYGSESYLAQAQRLSHTGSWTGHLGPGEIKYLSEEWYRMMGLELQKETPRFETYFQRIHADDRARTMEQFEKASRERWSSNSLTGSFIPWARSGKSTQ
jgi:hypothetical protein